MNARARSGEAFPWFLCKEHGWTRRPYIRKTYYRRDGTLGHHAYAFCRICSLLNSKAHYLFNRRACLARQTAWAKRNVERVRKTKREWAAKNRATQRAERGVAG